MNQQDQTLLTILPGSRENERIAVLLTGNNGGLELQHQSWGEGVGWFTQSSVALDPIQATLLRQSLGTPTAKPRRISADRPTLRVCAESA